MTIEFTCPFCDTTLRTPDERAGWQAKCPACSAVVDIPVAPNAPERPAPGQRSEWDDKDVASPDPDALIPPDPGERSGARTQSCPMCGADAALHQRYCPSCGEQLGLPELDDDDDEESYGRDSRAGLILAFAVASWLVCPIFGLVAWLMANEDLAGIRNGTINPYREHDIRIGRIIGAAHVVIVGAFVLFVCLIGGLVGLLG